jgi:hypothetical protein
MEQKVIGIGQKLLFENPKERHVRTLYPKPNP